MSNAYLSDRAIQSFISAALAEDIGEGDFSTLGAVPQEKKVKARLLVKDHGVIAGLELAEKIFRQFDSQLQVNFNKKDGDQVRSGDEAFIVQGPARSILSTERLVLNCMQRMSGIATYARKLSQMIADTGARLLDTRKTTPNFRIMEKWAVRIGGGTNHRIALDDMVMLKDNHVDLAGGIAAAIRNTDAYLKKTGKDLRIEIETRSVQEVTEVLATGGVDIIMLDNMSISQMQEAVSLIAGKYKTEASGGITEENLVDVAKCGVDYISIGALTHSVKSLDMSLKVLTAP